MRTLTLSVTLVALLVGVGAQAATQRQGRSAIALELTNSPQQLLPPIPARKVNFCVLEGGASSSSVIFRGVGGSPVYATINLGAGATVTQNVNRDVGAAGLEVATSAPAGDVKVWCIFGVQ